MSDFNSGRRGARPTSDATQSLVLEMASLTRAGLEPGLLARTTLHFGEEHFPVELTIDTRGEDAGFIDFAHDTRDTRSPERISYLIPLSWSQPHYGGQRYWFCCPGTGKRAAKLFLPRDRLGLMGWMAPSRHRCAKVGLSRTPTDGSHP